MTGRSLRIALCAAAVSFAAALAGCVVHLQHDRPPPPDFVYRPDQAASPLFDYEPDGAVQASARRFPDATTGVAGRTSWLSRAFPGNPLSKRNLDTDPDAGVRQVDWVSGALMLIRRETFDALGGFDERFFLYWEDADFCRRAALAGWSTWYAPVAEVVHRTARASRHAPTRSLVAFHVSAFRYYWKHGSALSRLLSPLAAVGLFARFLVRLSRRH